MSHDWSDSELNVKLQDFTSDSWPVTDLRSFSYASKYSECWITWHFYICTLYSFVLSQYDNSVNNQKAFSVWDCHICHAVKLNCKSILRVSSHSLTMHYMNVIYSENLNINIIFFRFIFLNAELITSKNTFGHFTWYQSQIKVTNVLANASHT